MKKLVLALAFTAFGTSTFAAGSSASDSGTGSGPRSPENNERCILKSSEEIFRLIEINDKEIAREHRFGLQVAPVMEDFNRLNGTSVWTGCAFVKYELDNGPVSRQYAIKLDRNCRVLKGQEEIRSRSMCPQDF